LRDGDDGSYSDWSRNPLRWIGTTIVAVLLLDALSEGLELGSLDVKEPLEVRAHLALHLVDLLEGVEVLSNDAPRLVGVGIVANHL
jgi:hypothetical protein